MTRGTFANVRIKNLMVPGVEGGYTLRRKDGSVAKQTVKLRIDTPSRWITTDTEAFCPLSFVNC
jgi:aconitase A